MYYQITNLFYNTTTYERFSKDKGSIRRSSSIEGSDDSRERLLDKEQERECSFRNCGVMCGREVKVEAQPFDDY